MSRTSKRPVKSPSFSSSLLDKVFSSIDEPTTHTTACSTSSNRLAATSEQKTKNIGPNRKKLDADNKKPERIHKKDLILNPSSEGPLKNDPYKMIGVMNLRPIRTSTTARTERCDIYNHHPDISKKMNREGYRNSSSKPKRETTTASASSSPSISLQNAKIRAQKLYGDLKDVKQPISPGGRLTKFITSLFTKRNSSNKSEKVSTRHVPVTTCSSATSYYRSCLSSNPIGGSTNSVRFCPDNPRVVELRREVKCELDGIEERRVKVRGAQSNLKELLKKYKYDRDGVMSIYDGKLSIEERRDGDNEDDDGGSCGSSDLFELDHIGGTVSHSISDELPVYETTKFPASICFGESRKITTPTC